MTPLALVRGAEPKFHFLEINTSQLSGLGPHITIDSRVQVVKVSIYLLIPANYQDWDLTLLLTPEYRLSRSVFN